MELIRKLTGSRMSRLGWALAILGLGALLALTFVFAWSAVGGQQRAAQARSVRLTTKPPLSDLSPGQVGKPILGEAAKNLTNEIGNKILSDSRVARLRIWSLSGSLAFSTDADEKLGVAQIDIAPFRNAASGRVASVLTQGSIPAAGGLTGSNERLYVTFAPLRLADQPRAAAVVEVDQRFASIQAAANLLWRPVQLAVGVLMILSLFMLVLSLKGQRIRLPRRAAAAAAAAGPGFTPGSSGTNKELEGRVKIAEETLRSAEGRLAAAEREKRQIAERLVTAHEQLELMTAAAKGGKFKGREGEGPKQLRKLERERDRMAAEIQQLQAALEARSAGGGDTGVEGGSAAGKTDKKSQARVEELEAALSDAQAKAASLESVARQMEEERKQAVAGLDDANGVAARHEAEIGRMNDEIAALKAAKGSRSKDGSLAAEAGAQLAEAEERLRQAEERAMKAVNEVTQAEERALAAEQSARAADERIRDAEDRASQSKNVLKLTEERAAEAEARAQQAEDRAREFEVLARQTEERARGAENRAAKAVEDAVARVAQLEAGGMEFEHRAVAAEQRVAQLQAVTKQAEERMTQLEAGARRAEQRVVQADMRLRELEEERAKLATELGMARAGGGAKLPPNVEKLTTTLSEREAEIARPRDGLAAKEVEVASKTESPSGEAEARVQELEAERAKLSAELEKALAERVTAVAVGSDDELATRIEELETQRRQDISELQRVREALANTQVELTAAVKRAKDVETQARKGGDGEEAPTASPTLPDMPEIQEPRELFARPERKARPPKQPDEVFAEPQEESIAFPMSKARGKKAEAEEAPDDDEQAVAVAAPSSEGLSLRERLARAAAARPRSSPAGEKDGD